MVTLSSTEGTVFHFYFIAARHLGGWAPQGSPFPPGPAGCQEGGHHKAAHFLPVRQDARRVGTTRQPISPRSSRKPGGWAPQGNPFPPGEAGSKEGEHHNAAHLLPVRQDTRRVGTTRQPISSRSGRMSGVWAPLGNPFSNGPAGCQECGHHKSAHFPPVQQDARSA